MPVIYTATVGGKSYGFDYMDQRIDVDATVDNMLVSDLWTAIKEAQAVTEGMSWDQIATGSGNDTLGTGIETFLTVTLLDNWEVNTLKSSGKFEVSGGNLIREDQADPFRDNPLITYIAFLSQAGIATQIETGVSGLTASESVQLASIDSVLTDTSTTIPAQIAALNNIATSDVDASIAAAALATAADLATVDSNVDAVKAKTDSLTFTKAGEVDSNLQSVNNGTVAGSGTELDPWGP